MPPGFGWWLFFLGGTTASVALLQNAVGMASWLYYMVAYLSATVQMVFTYNLTNPIEGVSRRLATFWGVIIVCGLLGVLLPNFEYKTPVAYLLPSGLADNALVRQLTVIGFADQSNFLGVPRPSAPFAYANRWGLAVLLTLPAALYVASRSRGMTRLMWSLLIVVSAVPIVFSLNRGLWIGIGLLALFMAVRAMRHGRVKQVLLVVAGVVAAACVVIFTSLGVILVAKISSDYSTNARASVYSATWQGFLGSPLFGHGSSGGSTGATVGGISLGSQGHLWTLLYSGGLLATIPFFIWLGGGFFRSSGATSGGALAVRLPLLLALPMTVIYAFVPDGVALLAICYGAALAASDQAKRRKLDEAAGEGSTLHVGRDRKRVVAGDSTLRSGRRHGITNRRI